MSRESTFEVFFLRFGVHYPLFFYDVIMMSKDLG